MEKRENFVWNEQTIREELARLDKKTGLEGAKLPIKYVECGNFLGCFRGNAKTDRCYFEFHLGYFHDPDFSYEEAVNVIRHEYAHYMDWMYYGIMPFGRRIYGKYDCHGETWKMCCAEIGARPVKYYDSRINDYYNKKHQEEDRGNAVLDTYHLDDRIIHPKWGEGIIVEIIGDSIDRKVIIQFTEESKKLSLLSVSQICQRVA